jgi:hypothetical protein
MTMCSYDSILSAFLMTPMRGKGNLCLGAGYASHHDSFRGLSPRKSFVLSPKNAIQLSKNRLFPYNDNNQGAIKAP